MTADLYAIMEEDVTWLKKKRRQRAFKSRCSYSGQDGQLTLIVQMADTRFVRCSGEMQYQGAMYGLLQKLRGKYPLTFLDLRACPSIVAQLVTSWYIFQDSKDWNEVSLFEDRARASIRTMQRTPSYRHELVMEQFLLAGWWHVQHLG